MRNVVKNGWFFIKDNSMFIFLVGSILFAYTYTSFSAPYLEDAIEFCHGKGYEYEHFVWGASPFQETKTDTIKCSYSIYLINNTLPYVSIPVGSSVQCSFDLINESGIAHIDCYQWFEYNLSR